jgi:hypothetical protein
MSKLSIPLQICGQYSGLAERSLTRDEALASGKCEVSGQILETTLVSSSMERDGSLIDRKLPSSLTTSRWRNGPA